MTTSSWKQAHLARALISAALLLGIAAAGKLLTPTVISVEFAHRLLGIAMGCVVVMYANEVPKMLTPLTRMRSDPATEQSLRRFVGWSLVLGGIRYSLAWLIAPFVWANLIAGALLALALFAAVLRYAWAFVAQSRP